MSDVVSNPGKTARYAGVLLVAAMWVANWLNYTDRQVIFSIFPILTRELHFSNSLLGLTASVFLWVYGLCSPVAGQVADRVPKRKLVIASLLLWSCFTLLTGFSNSAGMLLTLRGLIGITESLFMPAAMALLTLSFPAGRRSKVMALFLSAQLAGVVTGGWYGAYTAEVFHWRVAFYSLGTFGFLYALPYWKILPAGEPVGSGGAKKFTGIAVAQLAKVPTYRLFCFVIAAFVFVQFLLYTWLPDFFYARFSLGLTQAGLFSTVYLQGANLLGLLLGGLAGDWLYTRTPAARFWLTATGLLMAAPGVQILGNAPTLWQTEVGAVIYGLGSGLFMANFIVGVMEVVPLGVRASCVGVYNLMGSLVSGFAPWLGGLWKDTVGLPRLFSYAALLCLAAAVVVLVDIRWFFAHDFAKAQADLPVAQRKAGSGLFGPDLLDKNLRVQQIE